MESELFSFAALCPDVQDTARVFNSSLLSNLYQFKENTKNLPSQLDRMRPALRKARKWTSASLAVPWSLLLLMSVFGVASVTVCGFATMYKVIPFYSQVVEFSKI